MSRPFAPIAMRMPISRVRSVTETSMMFMIPIPPTRSEIDAIARRAAADSVLGGLVGRLRDLLLRADHEVRVLARRDPVPLAQERLDLRLRLVDRAAARTADAMNMSIFVVCFRSRITVV